MKNIIILLSIISVLSACSFKEDEPAPKPIPAQEKLNKDLFASILRLDFETVKELIAQGVDINSYDEEGQTPLMRAVQMGNPIMVDILLKEDAKIFQKEEDGAGPSAYKKINSGSTEILRIFKLKESEVSKNLKAYIDSGNFAKALSYSKENFLPAESLIEPENVHPVKYILSSVEEISSEYVEYLNHLVQLDSKDYMLREKLLNKILLIGSASRSEMLLTSAYTKFKTMKKTIVLGNFISKTDADSSWVIKKMNLMNTNHVSVSYSTVFKVMNEILNAGIYKDPVKKSEFLNALDLILSRYSKLDMSLDTSKFTALMSKTEIVKMVTSMVDLALTAKSSLNLANDILSNLNKYKLKGEAPSKDALVLKVLNLDLKTPLSYSLIESFTINVIEFFESKEKLNFKESLTYTIKENADAEKKAKLINLFVSKIDKLPNDLLASAIQYDKSILGILMKDGAKLDPKNQTAAIISTVTTAKSGDTSKSLLLSLREAGVPFDDMNGFIALKESFKKLWTGDDTFASVIQWLFSISDIRLANIQQSEKLDLLFKHSNFVRVYKKHWSFYSELLDTFQKENPKLAKKIDSKDLFGKIDLSKIIAKKDGKTKGIPYPLQEILITVEGVDTKMQSTQVMAVITSLFEVYRNNSDELSTIISIVKKLLEMHPNERETFEALDGVLDSKTFITHDLLKLSILFTMSEDEILEISNGKNEDNKRYTDWKNSLFYESKSVNSNLISWHKFLSSDIYSHYSSHKKFWSELTKILLLEEQPKKDALSHYEFKKFSRSIIRAGKLDDFPELMKILVSNFSNMPTVAKCITEDSTTLPSMPVHIGSFEVLFPLLEKSCFDKTAFTKDEKTFIKNFLKPKFHESPSFYLLYEPKYDSSSRINYARYFKYKNGEYGLNYTETGAALPLKTHPDVPENLRLVDDDTDKFRVYDGNSRLNYMAKLKFLQTWYSCFAANKDTEMLGFFDTFEKHHAFKDVDALKNIGMCKQEVL